MGQFIDLIGKRFNRWTVLALGPRIGKRLFWKCKCDCGTVRDVKGDNLRSGQSCSCGCLTQERIIEIGTKHGFAARPNRHPLYGLWATMRERCNNPKNKGFHRYGGRGITVCERWASFQNFIHDMGPRPAGTSLDRIDNDKGYSPENCRWATAQVQRRNINSRIINVQFMGRTMVLKDAARAAAIPYSTAYISIRAGKAIAGIQPL